MDRIATGGTLLDEPCLAMMAQSSRFRRDRRSRPSTGDLIHGSYHAFLRNDQVVSHNVEVKSKERVSPSLLGVVIRGANRGLCGAGE